MAYIATDRTGRFLFGASYVGAMLSVNAIGADGVPGEPMQVLATPPNAHSILPDPTTAPSMPPCWAATSSCARNSTHHRPDGQPATPAMRTAAGAGPRHLRFARGGALLYCLNEIDATLNTYARETATGALRTAIRARGAARRGRHNLAAADLHLTPDERFLYASVRATNVLTGFRVRADGTLEPSLRSRPNGAARLRHRPARPLAGLRRHTTRSASPSMVSTPEAER